MKSLALLPYCPLPANHGGKVEMWKHLKVLQSLGQCEIFSAASRPVGMGWNPSTRKEIEDRGFQVTLREEVRPSRNWRQLAGIAYAMACKGLRLEKAFGHANPYHRYAFHQDYWLESSMHANLAIINYSFWAWLPTACPKVIILLDLFSNVMWGGSRRETEDLQKADLIVVISKDEEKILRQRGLTKILWSPPLVESSDFPLSHKVGIIGSANAFNQEGLRWLSTEAVPDTLSVTIYGALSQFTTLPQAGKVKRYAESHEPYRDCGIILLPTALGMGVQIKVVEAIASGRAVVARSGAVRGLPQGEGAWIEVDTPGEMWAQAELLSRDDNLRLEQGAKARSYYERHLNSQKIFSDLRKAYLSLAGKNI